MKMQCIKVPGNWFLRTAFTADGNGVPAVKISADPHDYQKTFCMSLRKSGDGKHKYDGDWLLGNSYVKFRVFLDGKFIGCGPFRAVIDGNRMEHTFEFPGIAPGKHILAVIARCDGEGLAVEAVNGTLGKWKVLDANKIIDPICWEHPAVYGHFKGCAGPGEYFEHLRGDLLPEKWMSAGFDDSQWQDAEFHTVESVVETAPFNFEYETIRPANIRKCADGRYIVDFGVERIAGLQLTGTADGGLVEIRMAEELCDEERILYQMRNHICYQELWQFAPGRQTLAHFGLRAFRYAELVNYDEELLPENIAMQVVRAPYIPAAELTTKDVNTAKVWQLCENTIKNITCDTFVDCFTRERIAYEADALLTIGSFFTFNQFSAVARRHVAYQLKHPTWPNEWSQIIPLLFYEYYMETGDKTVVDENFDELVEYSSYRHLIKDDMIEEFPLEVLVDWPRKYRDRYDTGDWKYLSVPNMLACKVLKVLSFLAAETGRDKVAAELIEEHEAMKNAINARCFNEASGLYVDRIGSEKSSMYANMWALYADIAPEKRQKKVADFVAANGMDCSLYSGFYYLDVLFRYGHSKEAWEYIAKADSKWQEMLNAGCTATTEYWIGDVPMMSLAHPWGSYPAHFIVRYVFGMRPTAPGWKSYEIKPDKSLGFSGTLRMIRNGQELTAIL